MERIIDTLLREAKASVDLVHEFQDLVPIGLGDTGPDILACGAMHASAHETRTERGSLDIQAMAYETNGLARWHHGGLPRIRLSHGLAAQFALTDPSGIAAEEVRMPFRCYLLEFPFPTGPIAHAPVLARVHTGGE